MNKKVMIIAGEASGDLHGARLVSAMLDKKPELSFSGMGGKELAAVGVDLLFDAKKIAVVGLAEVLSHLPDIFAARKILRTALREKRPALLILIDFPDFNFILARYAKKLGIPVFYFISPQVWAWRPGRVKTMKKLVDRIGVILPFEEQFFRSRGVTADYVGHPLLDSVQCSCSREEFCRNHDIEPKSSLVGLMPGSRKKEVATLLPILLQTAAKMQEKGDKKMVFLLPVASTLSVAEIRANGVDEFGQGLDIHLITENRYDMMAACDAAVVVSGTVTLELALLDTPMVVFYKVSPSTYHIGRLLISKELHYFSLVNLIADAPVVQELFQEEVNPERLSEELSLILFDRKKREKILQGLALVRERMGLPGASGKAASLALNLLSEGKNV
jgi:lipid-A-disaccharide synthase